MLFLLFSRYPKHDRFVQATRLVVSSNLLVLVSHEQQYMKIIYKTRNTMVNKTVLTKKPDFLFSCFVLFSALGFITSDDDNTSYLISFD